MKDGASPDARLRMMRNLRIQIAPLLETLHTIRLIGPCITPRPQMAAAGCCWLLEKKFFSTPHPCSCHFLAPPALYQTRLSAQHSPGLHTHSCSSQPGALAGHRVCLTLALSSVWCMVRRTLLPVLHNTPRKIHNRTRPCFSRSHLSQLQDRPFGIQIILVTRRRGPWFLAKATIAWAMSQSFFSL
jgi:hypothetical protein